MKKMILVGVYIFLVATPVMAQQYFYERDYYKNLSKLDDDKVRVVKNPVIFGAELEDIIDSFGDPRSGGRSHEGLDILVPTGTPFVSPTEAVVIGKLDGYSAGLAVYTKNPGGETFAYLHMDMIREDLDIGDYLKEGEFIGTVGYTGNAIETAPHLHFEIRDGEALNPFLRVQDEFSDREKSEILEDIFDNIDDEKEYAQFLVDNFGTEVRAIADKYDLPRVLEKALDSNTVFSDEDSYISHPTFDTRRILELPIRILKNGDRGAGVIWLQEYLINRSSGTEHKRLQAAGATGYFGAITVDALEAFKRKKNIKPVNGTYGFETMIYILSTELQELRSR